MTTLAEDLVPDKLWAIVAPLLPAPPRPPYAGRHRTISDLACFAAIVYMARTSTPWRLLPARELGCGSPATSTPCSAACAATAWSPLPGTNPPAAHPGATTSSPVPDSKPWRCSAANGTASPPRSTACSLNLVALPSPLLLAGSLLFMVLTLSTVIYLATGLRARLAVGPATG